MLAGPGLAASSPLTTSPFASLLSLPLLLSARSGALDCRSGSGGSEAAAMGLRICSALFRRSLVATEACGLPVAACRRLSRLPAISCRQMTLCHHAGHKHSHRIPANCPSCGMLAACICSASTF